MGNFQTIAIESQIYKEYSTLSLFTHITFLAPIPSESSSSTGEQQPGKLYVEKSRPQVAPCAKERMSEVTAGLDGVWTHPTL